MFEFIASKPSPSSAAFAFRSAGSALSQGMCSDTLGVAAVSSWITAQSSSLSKMSRGSPVPGKRAKRVPPVPTPHDGTATPKAATLAFTRAMSIPRRSSCSPRRGIVAAEAGLRGPRWRRR